MISATDYHGWPAQRIDTGELELIAPTAIGPRVLHLSLEGRENLFYNDQASLGNTGEEDWQLRGGHRIWHAPEHPERTYVPDNDAVQVQTGRDFIQLTGAEEIPTGITKTMRIEVVGPNTFRLSHLLEYSGLWPVEFSGWTPTVMRGGCLGVTPTLPRGKHPRDLLPAYALIPWLYTDLGQPCWSFPGEAIVLDSAKVESPQKIGITAYPAWSAAWHPEGCFIKFAEFDAEADYPDGGSVFETFSNGEMLELETLGPLEELDGGDSIEHVEYWTVLPDVPRPDSEEVIVNELTPAVEAWIDSLPLE
jgi:hypothetical protein